MRPYLSAHHLWTSTCEYPWRDLIDMTAQAGILISTDDSFLAAVPDTLDNAGEYFSPLQYKEEAECWYIWLAAGKAAHLKTLASLAPYSLPWVTWHHKGRFKRIRWNTIARHEVTKAPTTSNSPTSCHLNRSGKRSGAGRSKT